MGFGEYEFGAEKINSNTAKSNLIKPNQDLIPYRAKGKQNKTGFTQNEFGWPQQVYPAVGTALVVKTDG